MQHQPWTLCNASVVGLEESLLAAVGPPEPSEDPLVHYSPGVEVRLGVPQPVEAGRTAA